MTAVFPSLAGLGFDVIRSPIWNTTVQTAVSGKETAINNGWTYPRWKWQLTYNFLRSDPTNAELQSLVGFFNSQMGQLTPFLYQDADDNAVTSQAIGEGDGTTTTFQLVRAFGSFIGPIFAPNSVSKVYVNGVAQTGWSVASFGSTGQGIVTLASAPASGAAVTADFSYYFPCRFTVDTLDFHMFLYRVYKCDGISFQSIKY